MSNQNPLLFRGIIWTMKKLDLRTYEKVIYGTKKEASEAYKRFVYWAQVIIYTATAILLLLLMQR